MHDAPALSVVIPTHKRAAILHECLRHLEQQTAVDELEVIVVSDGPDEETRRMMQETEWTMPVRYEEIPKAQQGIARNHGVSLAKAPLVLFLGDDAFLQEDACAKHIAAHHDSSGRLVLGHVEWDPACGITDAMRWLDRTGWQFGYGLIAPYAHGIVPMQMQHRFCYTIHISLPTAMARRTPFSPQCMLYGWEDILWGEELAAQGVPLFYLPSAKALHHHHLSLTDSLRRMERIGMSLQQMHDSSGEFERYPNAYKILLYRCIALLPTMRGKHTRALLRGMRQAKRRHASDAVEHRKS